MKEAKLCLENFEGYRRSRFLKREYGLCGGLLGAGLDLGIFKMFRRWGTKFDPLQCVDGYLRNY